MTSPPGAVSSFSCSATSANPSSPPSWNAISPHGVLRSGVPSLPPRPVIESNSVPTKTAVAAVGIPRHLRIAEDVLDPLPALRLRAAVCEVVEQRQGVGLAAAELGRQVEHRRGLDLHAVQAAHHLHREVAEVLGEVRALEELGGVLVDRRGAAVADVVEVDGELGGVERAPFAEILAGGDDLVPGLHGGVRFLLRASTAGHGVGGRGSR